MATKSLDKTALIPFVLFFILATIVGYSIWKGTRRGGAVQMKENVLYITPKQS